MCFGKNWSLVSFSVMVGTLVVCIIKDVSWRIVAILLFLAFKELLQFLLYFNLECNITNRVLSVFSWIHISLQPFFVLLFISAFTKTPEKYDVPIVLSLIFAFFNALKLKELHPFKIKHQCTVNDKSTSICCPQTCSYQGKYHIAYGFNLASADATTNFLFVPSIFSYMLLSFGVPFAIGDWQIASIHAFVAYLSFTIARFDVGEAAALWCLNSFWIGLLSLYYAFKGNPF